MKTIYTIGQKIVHQFAYPMTCSERFGSLQEMGKIYRATRPSPLFFSGEGFVIGLKRAIMGEYVYSPSKTYQDCDRISEGIPASATGKYEECLVCVKTLKPWKPYLVRKQDVVQ